MKIYDKSSFMSESLESLIYQKLKEAMPLQLFEFEDQSHQHADHYDEAKGGGTHIQLKIVSSRFNELSRVQRHRLIYDELDQIIKDRGIHAIVLKLHGEKV